MALDQTARAKTAGDTSQAEYDAIYDTMMASARGRWFLNEYARRNRTADTNAVLAAIDRIGAHLRGEALPPNAPEYLHLGLMAMAGLVAAVETDMSALSTGHETEESAKPRVKRVVSTLRDMGDCVQVMLDNFKPPVAEEQAPLAPPRPPAALTVIEAAAAQSVQAAAEAATSHSVAAQTVVPPAVDLAVTEQPATQQRVQQATIPPAPSAAIPVAETAALEAPVAVEPHRMDARAAESEPEEAFTVEALAQAPVAELNPQAAYALAQQRETPTEQSTASIAGETTQAAAAPVAEASAAMTEAATDPIAVSAQTASIDTAALPAVASETAAAFAVASAELVFETAPPDIEIFEWPPRKPSASAADITTIETLSIEPDAAISRPTVATLPLVEPLAASEPETAAAKPATQSEAAQPVLAQTQIAQAEIFPATSTETSADSVEAISAAAITEAAPARVTAAQLAEILAQAAAESAAAESSAQAGETGEAVEIAKPAATPVTTALPLEDFGPSNRVVLNYETDFEPIDLGVPAEMTAAARTLPAAGSVTATALPLQDLLPEDHPLAELRTLSKAELTALFS